MPSITVVRSQSSLGGTARRYKVLIDGVERAALAGGDEVEVDVDAGAHSVEVRIDWTGSQSVEVVVADDDIASFAVEPAAQTQLGQFGRIFGRHGYLNLRRIIDD